MLLRENFTEKYIRKLQDSSKKDPALLERTVYAFGLLEALARTEMPFIFQGRYKPYAAVRASAKVIDRY